MHRTAHMNGLHAFRIESRQLLKFQLGPSNWSLPDGTLLPKQLSVVQVHLHVENG